MKLNAQHHQAAQLLVSGISAKIIAEQLSVDPVTISRWKTDYDFKALLNSLLSEVQQETADKLRGLAATALDTIESLMADELTPAKDRLTAALKVLELTKTSPKHIGSTNAAVLKRDAERDAALESYGL